MNAGQRNLFLVLIVGVFSLIAFFYARSNQESSVHKVSHQAETIILEPQRRTQSERHFSPDNMAEGKVLPFEWARGSLESSIRSHPMPEVWLTLPLYSSSHDLTGVEKSDAVYKVQLPKKVVSELTKVWKAARYYYYMEFFGPKDSESRIERTNTFVTFLHNTSVEIESTTIKIADGKRLLSWEEAKSLVDLMNNFAKDLLLQADEMVRLKREAI